MEIKELDTLNKIIFISIFIVIMLLAVVVIIGALNSSNQQAGTVFNNNLNNETAYFQNSESGNYSLSVSSINNAVCSINSITYYNGTLIDPSNYTINNCQVTF